MTLAYNGTGTDSIVVDQAGVTIIVRNHGALAAESATTTNVSIAAGAGDDTVVAHHAPLIGHVMIGGGSGKDHILASANSTVSIDGGDDNDSMWLGSHAQGTIAGGAESESLVRAADSTVTIGGGNGKDSRDAPHDSP